MGVAPVALVALAAWTSVAVMAALTLAAVTLAAVTLAAVTLAAVTLAAVTLVVVVLAEMAAVMIVGLGVGRRRTPAGTHSRTGGAICCDFMIKRCKSFVTLAVVQ